jgi:hypothetical protein
MPRGSNFQKPYPPEFRREAVALYRSSGRERLPTISASRRSRCGSGSSRPRLMLARRRADERGAGGAARAAPHGACARAERGTSLRTDDIEDLLFHQLDRQTEPDPRLNASSLPRRAAARAPPLTRGGNASPLAPTPSRDAVFTAVPSVSNDDFGTRHGRFATGRGGGSATSSSTSYGTTYRRHLGLLSLTETRSS